MIAIALLSLGCGVAVGAIRARAQTDGAHFGIDIQATYTTAGNPSIGADSDGLAKPRWSICRPPDVDVCTPVKSRSQFLDLGPTAAGTVFEATATYKGHVYTARTATWLGAVHSTAPPRLIGRPHYGAAITARAGSWSGGWEPDPAGVPPNGDFSGGRSPDFDSVNIEACATKTAKQCVNLTPQAPPVFSRRPVTIGSAITGRYLFAFDQRYAADTAFDAGEYLNPASIPVVRPSPTAVSSAALGPITGPPRPRVTIIANPPPRDGQVAVARVRCSTPCPVFAIVTSKVSGTTVRTVVQRTELITVALSTVRASRLKVELFVGDGPRIDGSVHVQVG